MWRFLALSLLALPPSARAAEPWSALPERSNLVVVVDEPRRLIETLRGHPAYASAQTLPAVQELLDGTNLRRFEQLVGYYERAMGADWPAILDQVAGGGVAAGSVTGEDPAPALLVVEGTDEAASKQFFTLALKALEEESMRQNPDAKLRRAARDGAETAHLGEDFHAARRGKTLFVSNREATLNAGLAAKASPLAPRLAKSKAFLLADGKPKPLLWFSLDLKAVKATKASADFFAATRQDVLQNLVIGGTVDAVRRADFLAGGLFAADGRLDLVTRMPARRADLPPEFTLHVPAAGTPGSLPLLEPPGVVYSQSFTLDLGTFWRERAKFVNAQQLPDLEKAERDLSKLFSGPSLGKVLEMSGPHHRVVVLARGERPYKATPGTAVPPFALVTSMRDAKFGKSATAALRGAAFAATLSKGLTMREETIDGVKVVSYRFPEDRALAGDEGNLRYNFVPCFAVVGDSLVVASEPGVVRALLPELTKPRTPDPEAPVWRAKSYGVGASRFIAGSPEPLTTNLILTRNLGLGEAQRETQQIVDWLATLGTTSFEMDHCAEYHEARLTWAMPTGLRKGGAK